MTDVTHLRLDRHRLQRLAQAPIQQLADRPPLPGLGRLDKSVDDDLDVLAAYALGQDRSPLSHPRGVRVAGSTAVAGPEPTPLVSTVFAVW